MSIYSTIRQMRREVKAMTAAPEAIPTRAEVERIIAKADPLSRSIYEEAAASPELLFSGETPTPAERAFAGHLREIYKPAPRQSIRELAAELDREAGIMP